MSYFLKKIMIKNYHFYKKKRLDFTNLSKNNFITVQKEINFCIYLTANLHNSNIYANKYLPESGNLEYNSKFNIQKFKNNNISMNNKTKTNYIYTNFSNIDKKKKF